MKETSELKRQYILTTKEIKDKLGLKGNITKIGLWSGRSPDDEAKGLSADKDKWYIVTIED